MYVVKPGDTLSGIAAQFDISLAALCAANAALVTDPNLLRSGWELAIPGTLSPDVSEPPSGAPVEDHIVEPGDTLGALAAQWQTTVAVIAELNGIANPDFLVVGQRLRRPAPSEAPADVSAATTSSSTTAAVTEASAVRGVLQFSRYPLAMPPARITGGYREDYGGYLHRGIDIGGVPVGTPVVAPASGIVTVHRPGDGWGSGTFGICVVLDHPGTPWWSIYAHLSFTPHSGGEHVDVGDVLGEVGFTGKVMPPGPAGAHLHWQVSAHAWFPADFAFTANPLDFLRT